MAKKSPKVNPFDLMPCIALTIDALISGQVSPSAGMRGLLAVGNAAWPSPTWARLDRIKWDRDNRRAADWLKTRFKDKNIPTACKGLWFSSPTIYMNAPLIGVGAFKTFTRDDARVTWASSPMSARKTPLHRKMPEESFEDTDFVSKVLFDAALAIGVRPGEDFEDNLSLLDRQLLPLMAASLGYTCLLVAHLFRTLDKKLLLGSQRERGVSVGFVEGEHHQLGLITRKGWMPRPYSEWMIPRADDDR